MYSFIIEFGLVVYGVCVMLSYDILIMYSFIIEFGLVVYGVCHGII